MARENVGLHEPGPDHLAPSHRRNALQVIENTSIVIEQVYDAGRLVNRGPQMRARCSRSNGSMR